MPRRTRLDQRTLLALIECTYAAAEDISQWEPLLKSLSEAVGGTSACLISHDLVANGTAVLMAGLHPEVIPLYNQHYHKLDAWAFAPDALWVANRLQTVADEGILPRADLRKTEFYPYVLKYGISRMMHTTLRVDDRGVSGLSIYRSEPDAGFGMRETGFVQALAPHLGRALRLYERLGQAIQARDTAVEGLDAVPIGVLLVTRDGRVLHANGAAEQLLALDDGLSLDRSLLTATTTAATGQLRRLCAECARTTAGEGVSAGGALSIKRPSSKRNLQVLVSPVCRSGVMSVHHETIGAIVFVSDPESQRPPAIHALQTLYDLTPTESRIAALLASDQTVAEISERSGYTVDTVKWYSKQILGKTGCRNRAALVRELARSVTSLVDSFNRQRPPTVSEE